LECDVYTCGLAADMYSLGEAVEMPLQILAEQLV